MMPFNYFGYFYPFIPKIPNTCEEPPTIYAILNSYVNFGKSEDEKKKSNELAKYGRSVIFDFDYPLTQNINKESFEIMILNKFLMRRIGYETVNAFKISLSVKLNEIMPKYNIMFDAIKNWNLFNDGETYTRSYEETRSDNGTSQNNMTSGTNNTSDRRYSNVPQNQIQDIKDGDYMTDYNFDTDISSVTSQNNGTSATSGTTNINETTTRSSQDKIKLYADFLKEVNSVYTYIFDELKDLFFGLV